MDVIIHCNQQCHQDSLAFDLIRSFLTYQGISPKYAAAKSADVVKMTKGRGFEYSVEIDGKFFYDPMELISFFINNGLIRI